MGMNQKQRDYFVDRVTSLTEDKISTLRALHAAEIQQIAEEKYNEFVSAIGLAEDMDAIKRAEDTLRDIGPKVKAILNGLSDLLPNSNSGYIDTPSLYTRDSDCHDTFRTYIRACCKARAEKEFYNTDAGQELKTLEETKRQAVDTIMMDGSKVQDLTLKLNGILGKSGMQLLVEGVQG